MIDKGAANLLANCAGIRKRDRLLIVHEEPGLGYYDDEILCAILRAAQVIGAHVTVKQVPFIPRPTEMPADVGALMQSADQTVFLARIGDQLRFCDIASYGRMAVCYALDAEMLSSPYGTADHRAFIELKTALNRMLANARSVHVTCPCGTDFHGPGAGTAKPLADVGIKRFPLSVFTPIPAARYSGKVALPGFLVGTGSMYYEPYALEYEGALSVSFEAGRITRFQGSAAAVRAAEQHYQMVASRLGIDRDFVHSWHAGIHPGCEISGVVSDSYERWSGAAFGNPRLLHFHTCGAYAPGEISWNVVDPTITVDDIPVWQDGVLRPQLVPGGEEILARYPDIAPLFDAPKRNIGL
ncbi:hypothetical protein [Pseudaminobacter sp. NGMCC 1.201702]|uniref:hypothetical protein n=1 Tax=Pseudaminobacter sp. NGMCC 1.201702 TaxID=3391825 RepID=UPI0039EF4C3E